MATLTISIDRSGLSLPALVLSGNDDANVWGILPGFTLPGQVARIRYASSPFVHGDVATGMTLQQALLGFDVAPRVSSAADLTTAVSDLKAALRQLNYSTTVTLNGEASVWTCDPGNVTPAALDLPQTQHNLPTYSVTIPCYPVGA